MEHGGIVIGISKGMGDAAGMSILCFTQVTAILAAGHQLPFEVQGVDVDLPELQVRCVSITCRYACTGCAGFPAALCRRHWRHCRSVWHNTPHAPWRHCIRRQRCVPSLRRLHKGRQLRHRHRLNHSTLPCGIGITK